MQQNATGSKKGINNLKRSNATNLSRYETGWKPVPGEGFQMEEDQLDLSV